jgi:uncharacterized SAM-binding protein YcdF (DUF218 family)
MFYFFSKSLPPLIYPLGLACVTLGAALVLRARRRWQSGLVAVALIVLLLGGNRLVATYLTRSLEWQHLPSPELLAFETRADAIVVLGGGTRGPGFPRAGIEVNEAGDRVLYAARLYKRGVAPRILLSGGTAPYVGAATVSDAESMAELLVDIGIPHEALWLEPASRNTRENAVESAAMLDERGIERIVLVTSAAHMPRSYALFAKSGLQVIPAPTDFQVTQRGWAYYTRPNLWIQLYNLLPTATNLVRTTRALKEYLGMAVYGLRGWL